MAPCSQVPWYNIRGECWFQVYRNISGLPALTFAGLYGQLRFKSLVRNNDPPASQQFWYQNVCSTTP